MTDTLRIYILAAWIGLVALGWVLVYRRLTRRQDPS
jgi:hypothetical protein